MFRGYGRGADIHFLSFFFPHSFSINIIDGFVIRIALNAENVAVNKSNSVSDFKELTFFAQVMSNNYTNELDEPSLCQARENTKWEDREWGCCCQLNSSVDVFQIV
jgi:hypothetical protein